ncbi:MAG: hypothetical protein C0485_05690 [Pirellula sp.]|nr:hypothetical protein [Pirellula sp.]
MARLATDVPRIKGSGRVWPACGSRLAMTLGFIVGKFYPPHRGHKHLIESARRQVDHLIVMIAAHPEQTIPGELRKAWLEEIHPDCEIRLVPDELENDSRQWADFTIRYLGRAPDVVFTSEDYGPVYAELMGSRHVMIDRDRTAFPVSGTLIREGPLNHLDMLEPCVRAYFVRRIVLIGAESTGKTTLAQQLAEQFDTIWVPEYGREHWERKLAGRTLSDPPPSWSHDEFVDIAEEQQRRENLAARTAKGVSWGLVGASVRENNTVEHLDRLFATAKDRKFPVFISPHYLFPFDQAWQFGGLVEHSMLDEREFFRPDPLSVDGFANSGADWLDRFKPYIEDGETIVVSPHKVWGPQTNDLVLQLRKLRINKVILAGMLANLCVESHLRELLEQGFEIAVVKDATAGPRHPTIGDGYQAAVTNYGFLANDVLTTDHAVKLMGN